MSISEYELPIIIHEEDGGFIALCPKWQDCYAQGNTLEEAINEISYVASSLIELRTLMFYNTCMARHESPNPIEAENIWPRPSS